MSDVSVSCSVLKRSRDSVGLGVLLFSSVCSSVILCLGLVGVVCGRGAWVFMFVMVWYVL